MGRGKSGPPRNEKTQPTYKNIFNGGQTDLHFGERSSAPVSGPPPSRDECDSQTDGSVDELSAQEYGRRSGIVDAQNFSSTNKNRKRRRTTHTTSPHINGESDSFENDDTEFIDGANKDGKAASDENTEEDPQDANPPFHFFKTYEAMENTSKWTLQSGTVVEDVLFNSLKTEDRDMLS
ncbi:hypothetical protein OEA41_001271 [Lepraria neglecta]|uniref:Uncharacterized protein n=1 Tax=Lepraria neglecta TaxID=209136 RepID=A0AAD9ZCX4_9LECA|nr:hypothetical protein OEA41_001271 [Lepraria neglecta]